MDFYNEIYDKLKDLRSLKLYDKIQVTRSGTLLIDRRYTIYRFFSKDSRWYTIEALDNIYDMIINGKQKDLRSGGNPKVKLLDSVNSKGVNFLSLIDLIIHTLDILIISTYKDDPIFRCVANRMINKYTIHLSSVLNYESNSIYGVFLYKMPGSYPE